MEREPRNWRKYWHSYTAHVAQGLVVGFALPTTLASVLAFVGYLVYQVVEYGRCRDIGRGSSAAIGRAETSPISCSVCGLDGCYESRNGAGYTTEAAP